MLKIAAIVNTAMSTNQAKGDKVKAKDNCFKAKARINMLKGMMKVLK